MTRQTVLSIAFALCALATGCAGLGGMFEADVRVLGSERAPAAESNHAEPSAGTTADAQRVSETKTSHRKPRFKDTAKGRVSAELHALAQHAVVATKPELTLDDAYDPTVVASVIDQMPRSAWVVWTGPVDAPSTALPARVALEFRASPGNGRDGRLEGDGSPVEARFVRGTTASFGPAGDAVLPVGIPLLLWGERYSGRPLLVSADGDVWEAQSAGPPQAETHVLNLVPVDDAEVRWPEAPVNTGLDSDEVIALEKAGLLALGSRDQIGEAQKVAYACATEVWDAAEPKFDAIRRKALPAHTRDARLETLGDKTIATTAKKCRKALRAVEAAFASVTADRLAARQALLDASRVALGQ